MALRALQCLAVCSWACSAWLCLSFGYAVADQPQVPFVNQSKGAEHGSARRLVSLAPSLTEIVYALGAGNRVVGVTRYCDYPPETARIKKIGGFADPHLESIVALRPTMVLALQDQLASVRGLSQLAIPLLTVKQGTVEEIYASIAQIGQGIGREAEATALVASMKRQVGQISSAVQKEPSPRVLLAVGGHANPTLLTTVYAANHSTFYGELIELAGGRNAYQGAAEYGKLSLEAVLTIDPDVIIELLPAATAGDQAVQQRLFAWQEFSQLRAVSQRTVHVFAEDYVVTPGPRIVEILALLAKAIHTAG